MLRLISAALLALGLTSSALADGKVYVPLPDMSPYEADHEAADLFLRDLYRGLVLASNCPNTSLSDEEHSLLTDGFDLLAYGVLHLSVDDVVERYEGPAFSALDAPNACDDAPGLKANLIDFLISLGGSLTPLPDQDQAYREWRELMDRIQPY